MARKADPTKKIITATLKLAAAKPWREISMEDIAEAAKIKLDDLNKTFSSKLAILNAFNRQIDDQTAKSFGEVSPDETTRDQLFEIMMSRFDALQPHKKAIKSILRETVPYDPIASICGLRTVMRSMGSALDLTGIRVRTPIGCLKAKALAAIYLRAFKTWLGDDSADMAKTMALIDDGLAKAENLAKIVPKAA